MKLTDNCEKDFEKWLHENNHESYNYAIENNDDTGIPTYEGRYFHFQDIYNFPFSMQYGVLVDFFDSVEIYITIEPFKRKDYDLHFTYNIIHKYIKDFKDTDKIVGIKAGENPIPRRTTKGAKQQVIMEVKEFDKQFGINQKL